MLGGAVLAYVTRLQSRIGDQEKALTDYKLEAAQHYVSKEYLGESERRILDSIHDLPRRIDHVFHTRQEKRKGPDRSGPPKSHSAGYARLLALH
jgi:hypothetical protein